jgi:segregation and condensation protein B
VSDKVAQASGEIVEESGVERTDAASAAVAVSEPPSAAEGSSAGAQAGAAADPETKDPDDRVSVDAFVRDSQAVAHAALAPPAAGNEAGRVADPQLKAVIEALIFASPEPLTPKMLFRMLEGEPKEDVELAVDSLRRDYEGHGGLQIVEVAGGYQIVTRAEMHEWVRRLFHERKTQKLSVQALETLAVIAYKQPVTGPEITEIRGVNTAGVLSTLLERHLIKIAGRKAVVGRPFLYATTREFLIRFGLRDLGDLPKVEDLADVLGFEPPAGLADSGPSEARLPLEGDGEADGAPEEGAEGEGEQVH